MKNKSSSRNNEERTLCHTSEYKIDKMTFIVDSYNEPSEEEVKSKLIKMMLDDADTRKIIENKR